MQSRRHMQQRLLRLKHFTTYMPNRQQTYLICEHIICCFAFARTGNIFRVLLVHCMGSNDCIFKEVSHIGITGVKHHFYVTHGWTAIKTFALFNVVISHQLTLLLRNYGGFSCSIIEIVLHNSLSHVTSRCDSSMFHSTKTRASPSLA